MASKPVKICSTSKEILVKTEITYFATIRLVEIFKICHSGYRQRRKTAGTPIQCWRKQIGTILESSFGQ